MSFSFTKSIFKICIAQICQNIGWQSVQTSPMDILIDVLHRYLLEVSKSVHRYSNQYGRTEPNLDDLALTFQDFGISLQEIEEYVNNVEPVPFVHKLPSFPVAHPSQLFHPKPSTREVLHRSEHIPEYLPLMHTELEEEEGLMSPVFDNKRNAMDTAGTADCESPSPLSSPKHGTKRPSEWSNDSPTSKKPRLYAEDDGRPMREVTSVFMTPTGFISPAREGKAAESTLPHNYDSPPSTPEPQHIPETSKKEGKSKDSRKDKSSRSKKDKDKDSSKKDLKKSKSMKKENKENNAISSEKSGTPSSSSKKDHCSVHKSSSKSDKSSKSGDSSRQKAKSDKSKYKDGKDDHKKSKVNVKVSKLKSKLKRGSSFGSGSKSPKSSRAAKSPVKPSSAVKLHKKISSKTPKSEKKQQITIPVTTLKAKKEDLIKSDHSKTEAREERPEYSMADLVAVAEDRYRDESPEPTLVIDDSIETQVKQEKESRIAVVDECINAVIQRGKEESEKEVTKTQRFVDDTIDEVIRGPVIRRLEPKDIYDFTDSSELSSLSSLEENDDIDDDSGPDMHVVKKEKSKTPESSDQSSEPPKRNKEKQKKQLKTKKSSTFVSQKHQPSQSPNVIVKREGRSPSPIKLKDEIYSSDSSLSSHSPSPANFFDMAPSSPQKHTSVSVSSPTFSSSPFAPIKPLPCHIQSNPTFPTPPLFVGSKGENASSPNLSSNQPFNLTKNTVLMNRSPEREKHSPVKTDDAIEARKSKTEAVSEREKGKSTKFHRKDKKDKAEKKDSVKKKLKDKKEKDKPRVKEIPQEKDRPKEKVKPKLEKRGRGRPEKKKEKSRDEVPEDSAVPKFTLKLASGSSGSGKFFIKPSKHSLPSSPPSKESSASPDRVSSPSPTRAESPTEEPTTPSPMVQSSPPRVTPTLPQQASGVSHRGSHSRGRGRGRKPNAQPSMPPARTVITETLGTIVDDHGNKIWICPACTRPDDGSPMIGCDECDDWYHWICVGIVVPPKEEESWFCTRCLAKRQATPAKRRRRKHKKDK